VEQLELVEKAEADLDVAALWNAVETVASRESVSKALEHVEQLVPEDDGAAEIAMRNALATRYNTVRRF
jgi:hypothetical protein